MDDDYAGDRSSGSDSGGDSRWKDSKAAGGMRAAGSSLMKSGQSELNRSSGQGWSPVSFKRGGKVRKMKRKLKMRAKPRK